MPKDELNEREAEALDNHLENAQEDIERAYAKCNAGYSKEKVRLYIQSALDEFSKIQEILRP